MKKILLVISLALSPVFTLSADAEYERLMDTESIMALVGMSNKHSLYQKKVNTGTSQRICMKHDDCHALIRVIKGGAKGYDYYVVDEGSTSCDRSRCGEGNSEFVSLHGVNFHSDNKVYPEHYFRVIPQSMRNPIQIFSTSGKDINETLEICNKVLDLMAEVESEDLKFPETEKGPGKCVPDGTNGVRLKYTVEMKSKLK